MKMLSSEQVKRLLKKSDGNYLQHYITECTIYDEGDDIGRCSNAVFNNLLSKEIIEQVAISKEFWSKGYYKLRGGN